jgi:hypothetical protein
MDPWRLAAARSVRHQLVLRWGEHHPLPHRPIRAPHGRHAPAPSGTPWHDSGPADQPFDFGGVMRRLIADIVARSSEFARVEPASVLIGVSPTDSSSGSGTASPTRCSATSTALASSSTL